MDALSLDTSRVTYVDADHSYFLDGVRVPAVSDALRCASFDAFDKVDPEVLAAAAAEGQAVHELVHQDCLGVLDVMRQPVDLLPYVDAWREFLEVTGFTVLASEQLVFSDRFRYCGRLDLFGQFPNRTFGVIDTKRVAQVQRTTGLQTAGYKTALCEMMGVPEDGHIRRFALQMRPGRKAYLHEFKDAGDRKVFLSATNVAHWRLHK
jgi:hypothetical protein